MAYGTANTPIAPPRCGGLSVQFSVDYPGRPLSRLRTASRIALVIPIPIAIVLGAVSGTVTVAAVAGLGSSEHLPTRP